MTHQLFQLSLKVIMKNEQGEVLCLENPADNKYAGTYEFPGGRADTSEIKTPFVDILNREIKEELGDKVKCKISPKPVAVFRQYIEVEGEEVPVIWLLFEAAYLGGDVTTSSEYANYSWIKVEEINIEEKFKRASGEGIKSYLGLD